MLISPQVNRALLRKDESRKHLEWRLCGSAVSNLSKTSGMHIKSFINIYYIHLYFPIFLTVYTCFAFKNYSGTSKLHFEHWFELHPGRLQSQAKSGQNTFQHTGGEKNRQGIHWQKQENRLGAWQTRDCRPMQFWSWELIGGAMKSRL
jgi:hypothetical protein